MTTNDKWWRYSQYTHTASWLMRGWVLINILFIFIWCISWQNQTGQGIAYWLMVPKLCDVFIWMDVGQYVLGALVFHLYARYDEYTQTESNHYYGVLFLDLWFFLKAFIFMLILIRG